MTTAVIVPYKMKSEAAKVLSKYTNIPLKSSEDYEAGRLDNVDVVINWGSGYLSNNLWRTGWLNKPSAIDTAVHKLNAFQVFKRLRVPIPEFTTSIDRARELNQHAIIVARRRLSGMMGDGIEVIQLRGNMPSAPLYTVHVEHRDEYRVHVFKGQVINVGKKVRADNTADPLIRNWGAWKFRCEDIEDVAQPVIQAGVKAVNALGLDFGAADVGFCPERGAYVFEVNTAPGTGHNTITKYAEAIEWYLGR